MKSKIPFLAAAATTLLLMASPAFAQLAHGAGSGDMPKGVMMGERGGHMDLSGLSPEKRETIRVIQGDYRERLFLLHQDSYAKLAALNAVMLQSQPDPIAAKAVSRELGALKIKEMDMLIEMHTRIARETGVRMPMGHAGRWMMN